MEGLTCLIMKCIAAIENDFSANQLEDVKAEYTSLVKNTHYLRIHLKSRLIFPNKKNSKKYCRNICKMKPSL